MFPKICPVAIHGLALSVFLCSCQSDQKEESAAESRPAPDPPGKVYLLDDPEMERPVGWTSVKEYHMTGSKHPASLSMGDQKLEGAVSMEESRRETLQSLGVDRRRLTVQRDNDTVRSEIGGTPTGGTTKGPLVGKYIILERRDGKWTGQFESGAEPTAEESEAIAAYVEAMNEGDGTYAQPSRRVGEEWEVDATTTTFGKDSKGVVRVRFDRVEEHRGEPCAVLTGSLDLVMSEVDGAAARELRMQGTYTTYRSLQSLVDIHTEMTGTVETRISPKPGVTVTSKGPIRILDQTKVSIPAPVPVVSGP